MITRKGENIEKGIKKESEKRIKWSSAAAIEIANDEDLEWDDAVEALRDEYPESEVYELALNVFTELRRGAGRGKGGDRQGDGGAAYCVCPKCDYSEKHEKGTPCTEKDCPECGTKLEGRDEAPAKNVLYCECGHVGMAGAECPDCGNDLSVEEMAVKPFKPVGPRKPRKSGAKNNEYFKLEEFENLPSGKYDVEPKYDGVWMELHRDGDEVKLYTDEGNEYAERFPGIVEEAKKIDADNFVVAGEMVKYRNRKRLDHTDVTAYIHRKDPEGDKWNDHSFRFKPFTIVYLNGDDLSSKSIAERREILGDKIPSGKQVHPTSFKTVDHEKGSRKLIDAIKDRMTREGAMIKNHEATYSRRDTKLLYKWKKQDEVDAKVLSRKSKEGGGYVYSCAVGRGDNEQKIGETFATSIDASKGNILTVSVDRVTYDKKKDAYTWYAPKVTALRGDKKHPDPLSTLKRIAFRKGGDDPKDTNVVTLGEVIPRLKEMNREWSLSLVGGIVEKGYTVNDIDIVTKEELSDEQKKEVQDALGEYGDRVDFVVDENGPSGPSIEVVADMSEENLAEWKHSKDFVIQEHGWGKKTHWDLRFGAPKTPRMWGWTLFTEPPKEAGNRKVRCQEKKYHDPKWMDVNKKDIKPGEEGNPTKNLKAYMVIRDEGKYNFIRRKPGFLEVMLHGKKWNGRYLFREIKVENKSKNLDEQNNVKGDEVEPKNEKIWIMWKPKDQEPSRPVKKMAYKMQDSCLTYWQTDEIDEELEALPDVPIDENGPDYTESPEGGTE